MSMAYLTECNPNLSGPSIMNSPAQLFRDPGLLEPAIVPMGEGHRLAIACAAPKAIPQAQRSDSSQ